LRALTLTPAVALGLDDRVGSLAPGRDGDVVVQSGDPLDVMSLVSGGRSVYRWAGAGEVRHANETWRPARAAPHRWSPKLSRRLQGLPDELTNKDLMGPVRLTASVAFYAAAYLILRALQQVKVLAQMLSPVTLLGQRSLDSYLILSSVVLVLPSLVEVEGWSRTAVLLGCFTLLACVAWAALRRWRDPLRVLSLPSAKREDRVPV
jgi:hypothetical protein